MHTLLQNAHKNAVNSHRITTVFLSMTEEQKQIIREKLVKSRERTLKRVSQLSEDTAPVAPDCAIGRVSRMDAINNKGVSEAALANARDKIRDIEESLSRIDTPDFGYCKSCTAEIAVDRLMVMPESLYCMRCARK